MFRDENRIRDFTSNSQSTHNKVATNSACMLVHKLQELYAGETSLSNCLAELTELAGTDARKLRLVRFLRRKANEPNDQLDLATLYLPTATPNVYEDKQTAYPVNEVLPLVWAAIKDHSHYMHASEGNDASKFEQAKVAFKDRIEHFFNCVEATEIDICHTGIRNELVFILNGTYAVDYVHPVELLEDGDMAAMAFIRDTTAKAFTDKMAEASAEERIELEAALLSWMRDVSPQEILVKLNIEKTIRGKLEKLFIAHGLNPTEKVYADMSNNMLNGLSYAYSHHFYPKVYDAVNNIINAVEPDKSKCERALANIKQWIETGISVTQQEHADFLIDFDRAYRAFVDVKRNRAHFQIKNVELMHAYNAACDAYFTAVANGGRPAVSDEMQALIVAVTQYVAAFKKDKLQNFIENFFANWYQYEDYDYEQRGILFRHLVDESVQEKIIVSDEDLTSLINRDNTVDLDPYWINRVFLHAMIVDTHDWSPAYATALGEVLEFVKNSFNLPATHDAATRLRSDSYPSELLQEISALITLHSSASAYDLHDRMIRLPQFIKNPRWPEKLVSFLRMFDAASADLAYRVYVKYKATFDPMLRSLFLYENSYTPPKAPGGIKVFTRFFSEQADFICEEIFRLEAALEILCVDDDDAKKVASRLIRKYAETDSSLGISLSVRLPPLSYKNTYLMDIAAWLNDVELLELLVSRNAEMTTIPERPSHILFAIAANADAAVDFLLTTDLNVNAKDVNGQTAMHHAAIAGNCAAIEKLVAKGAITCIKDIFGKTPQDVATGDAIELFRSLESTPATATAKEIAALAETYCSWALRREHSLTRPDFMSGRSGFVYWFMCSDGKGVETYDKFKLLASVVNFEPLSEAEFNKIRQNQINKSARTNARLFSQQRRPAPDDDVVAPAARVPRLTNHDDDGDDLY